MPPNSPPQKPRIGLFVTCLVDLIRPSIGFAAVKLLEEAGCVVEVPSQTCCGQPAYNSGDRVTARAIASQVIAAFGGFDYVVAPSGSCAGMIRAHFPELFADDPNLVGPARALAEKTYELVSFLVDVMKIERVKARFDGQVTYHNSCSGLRELGIRAQPRNFLAAMDGLELTELVDQISVRLRRDLRGEIRRYLQRHRHREGAQGGGDGAPTLLAGDLGCLMNMAGKLSREGDKVAVRHVAEVLAGMTAEPPIGAPAPKG